MRKWHIRNKGRWLIVTRIGTDMKRYPAVMKHLKQWEPQLRARQDQGENWWELRACAYYNAFEQPKILFPDLAKESRFTIDYEGMYTPNTTYLIPSGDQTLLGVLNSSAIWFYAKHSFSSMGDTENGGRLRFFTQFVYELPIPAASSHQSKAISAIVDRILAAKKADPSADTSALEAEIDQMVYQLYGLTQEEIAIVEGSGQKSSASAKATADKDDGEMDEAEKPKKKRGRKAQAALPASLPGWD